MKFIKKTIQLLNNLLPKEINFKRIYIMGALYSLCEIAILFIFSYYGIDKAFKENSLPLFIIVKTEVFR